MPGNLPSIGILIAYIQSRLKSEIWHDEIVDIFMDYVVTPHNMIGIRPLPLYLLNVGIRLGPRISYQAVLRTLYDT